MSRNKRKIVSYLIPLSLLVFFITYISLKHVFAQEHAAGEKREGIEKVENKFQQEAEELAEEGHKAEKKVEPGKLIIDHIVDAHDWHITTVGHTHVTIPLPVIIKDEQGLKIFSSSRFEHGHAIHEGYKLDKGKIVAVNDDGSPRQASFFDLSITKNVAAMFISVFVLCWLMLSIAKRYSKNSLGVPSGAQSLLEPLILFIRDDVAKPSIGPKYEKFLPYLLTLFFFIFINNLFGLIPFFPGGANVTGNIAVTMVMALFTFIITTINGNKNYWKHIFAPPGVPGWLWPLMVIIEVIGMLNKPIVLTIRLFANITAGHIIILGFFCLIFIFGAMNTGLGFGVSVFSVAFTVFMSMLELLVALLQA